MMGGSGVDVGAISLRPFADESVQNLAALAAGEAAARTTILQR